MSGRPKPAQTFHLAQTAPGRYEARVTTPPPGAYQVTVLQTRNRQPA